MIILQTLKIDYVFDNGIIKMPLALQTVPDICLVGFQFQELSPQFKNFTFNLLYSGNKEICLKINTHSVCFFAYLSIPKVSFLRSLLINLEKSATDLSSFMSFIHWPNLMPNGPSEYSWVSDR
jgi:hypothetical protein